MQPLSSYYFLIHNKLFQADNFNVNVRSDLLYFSIWGVYSKTYQKHNVWPLKTAKTLCTLSRRLVWWNVLHSTKISAVFVSLKAKGQNYWMPLVYIAFHEMYTFIYVSASQIEIICNAFPCYEEQGLDEYCLGYARESAYVAHWVIILYFWLYDMEGD